jgi:serine/threonine-protein kinase
VSQTLEPGDRIAGYRIERQIGRGGMAVVYLAEQVTLGRMVALKLLAPELADDAGFRERFVRESRLAASIDHPNIVPIYEADEADGTLFIAMRFVEGSDLKELLRREGGRLDLERALSIHEQVASALDAAHDRGLVHRDVKPGNVLLAPDPHRKTDHAYLSDFGLVKRSASASGLTGTGQFVGTLDYVAPEQMRGGAVDGAVDVYSLGCMLFQSVTGSRPFERDSDVAVMYAHLNEPPPAPSAVDPSLPVGLDDVVATAMAKEPRERYASCSDLVAAAREAAAGRRPSYTPTVEVPAPPDEPERPPPAPPSRSSGRRTALLVGVIAAAVAVAVGAFVLLGGPDEPTAPAASGTTGATAGHFDASQTGVGSVFRIDPDSLAATEFVVGGDGSCGCSIAQGEDSVWVASSEGSVVRLEPTTGELQAVIPIEPSEVGVSPGIAVGEGSVWVISRSVLQKIDPATDSVTATVPIALTVPASDVGVGRGFVFVPDVSGIWMQDVRLSDAPNKFPVQDADRLSRISVSDAGVWVLDLERSIVHLAGLGNHSDVQIPMDGPLADVASDRTAFVLAEDGRTFEVTRTARAKRFLPTEGNLGHGWVVQTSGGDFLYGVDPVGRVVWQVAVTHDIVGVQAFATPTTDLGVALQDVVATPEAAWAV